MILDTLANAAQYKGIHAGIDMVLEAAKAYTPENYPSGRVVLDGDNVFMNMAAYETHGTETAIFEAHKQYIDVMVMPYVDEREESGFDPLDKDYIDGILGNG